MNNTNMTWDTPIATLEHTNWDRARRTHRVSIFNTAKSQNTPTIEHGWGRIVNIASTGITINVVSPGYDLESQRKYLQSSHQVRRRN